jgi:5-methyltetrahydrofolate--homocysteine methyltransferase
LVDIILSNNGYRVVNLGIKQSVDAIIEAYEQHKPDCIAMSGLLVKSTAFMKENLHAFNDRGITVPVILGGAALTPKFVYEDCQNAYNGQVIYGKDAFSDLHFMDKLMPAKVAGEWDDVQGFLGEEGRQETEGRGQKAEGKREERGERREEPEATQNASPTPDILSPTPVVEDTQRSEAIAADIPRPTPPFWGTKIIQPTDITWDELFRYLDLQALIAGQWQFRKPREQSREEYDEFLQKTVYPILDQWKHRIVDENLLHPQAIYGYFPAQADGNSLHLYDVNNQQPTTNNSIATFTFPRQKSLRRYCIADYYAPKDSGLIDVFPMQAVTMGEVATEYAKKLFDGNSYTDYLYFHGIAVQMAEALAEWVHARIRRELGFGSEDPDNIRDVLAQRYRGSRYSFGYPACPNMQDQYTLLNLLDAKRINLHMDEGEQLHPEQSTTAIVAYHPAASYFSA